MRIEKPSFEIWPQGPGLDGIYRQIERVGRVCYKSEDHVTAGSARPFVERMIKNKHYAMLEHGTVYLSFPPPPEGDGGAAPEGGATPQAASPKAQTYSANPFSRVHLVGGTAHVTTNLRVLAENGWLGDLESVCEPTPHHALRVTVHFTTQIAITREFNRHRADSMAEQSTRYCNYSRAKFGNEVTLCLPTWVAEAMVGTDWAPRIVEGKVAVDGDELLDLARRAVDGTASDLDNWVLANAAAERAYLNLIAAGRKPQEARVVLPLDTGTELVHTAFVSDWRHFFDLRALGTTGAPHPDAKALAGPLYEEFQKRGWL